MSQATEDRRIALIKACNLIAGPHFDTGGRFTGGYESQAHAGLILAADSARWALELSRPTAKRVCDLMRAREEMGRCYANDGDVDATHTETVENAISFALSLVCERIDARETKAGARR